MNSPTTKIQLAISTCPNDTFAFHGILAGEVDLRGLEFEIQLLDIEQLNEGLLQSRFDVAKASFHAAILLADRYCVLPVGSALGFGVGPVLLSRHPGDRPGGLHQRTLCPGKFTTASLLFQMFHGNTQVEHVVFSEIMPKLARGQADFGVCIHEGRFTYRSEGLSLVEDLGSRWEEETGCPLPLGGLLAKHSLPTSVLTDVVNVISDSIQFGLHNRNQALSTMRQYAQEFDDQVLFQHVDLYVNQWTSDLGSIGRAALQKLSTLAEQRLQLPASGGLVVWDRDQGDV